MPSINPDVLEKLRTFDTPTICNLIELFDVRPRTAGYMDGRIRAAFPEMPPIVGYASTATFRASAPPVTGDTYVNLADQIERFGELDGPAVVVFQDLDDPSVAATFGEIMCTVYQIFGAVGLITSGSGRDLEQVRDIGFPVFTDGTVCSHGYSHTVDLQVPVHVGGLVVAPNTLLHGDLNGVTDIPHEIASELADIGDDFVAAEGVILEAMRSGQPTPQILREAMAESKAQAAKLRQQVSRKKKD